MLQRQHCAVASSFVDGGCWSHEGGVPATSRPVIGTMRPLLTVILGESMFGVRVHHWHVMQGLLVGCCYAGARPCALTHALLMVSWA